MKGLAEYVLAKIEKQIICIVKYYWCSFMLVLLITFNYTAV